MLFLELKEKISADQVDVIKSQGAYLNIDGQSLHMIVRDGDAMDKINNVIYQVYFIRKALIYDGGVLEVSEREQIGLSLIFDSVIDVLTECSQVMQGGFI